MLCSYSFSHFLSMLSFCSFLIFFSSSKKFLFFLSPCTSSFIPFLFFYFHTSYFGLLILVSFFILTFFVLWSYLLFSLFLPAFYVIFPFLSPFLHSFSYFYFFLPSLFSFYFILFSFNISLIFIFLLSNYFIIAIFFFSFFSFLTFHEAVFTVCFISSKSCSVTFVFSVFCPRIIFCIPYLKITSWFMKIIEFDKIFSLLFNLTYLNLCIIRRLNWGLRKMSLRGSYPIYNKTGHRRAGLNKISTFTTFAIIFPKF